MEKILIIEDDTMIALELQALLKASDYEAVLLEDFKNALDFILQCQPDLILMDINIPYLNGELLLKNLRKVSSIPVIMVTSRNNESDEVLSMSYGADDYITKPYNPTILLLRIGAILKRMNNHVDKIQYKDLTVIPEKGLLSNKKTEIELTKNEMIIFQHLLSKQGSIVSRDEIMTDLWNNEEYINENALTVNISRLRAKLSKQGYSDVIKTKKGQGYILI